MITFKVSIFMFSLASIHASNKASIRFLIQYFIIPTYKPGVCVEAFGDVLNLFHCHFCFKLKKKRF